MENAADIFWYNYTIYLKVCLDFVIGQILTIQPSAVTLRMRVGTIIRINSCSETSNMACSQKWQAQHREQVFLIRNYCESTAGSWGGLMRMEIRKKRNRLIAGVSTRLK